MKLHGQVAVITGAGRGIGRATAQLFAAEGGTVVVNDIDMDSASETVATLGTTPGRHIAHAADVADSTQVRGLIARTAREFGRIDVLVNNAGIASTSEPQPDPDLDPSLSTMTTRLTDEAFARMLQVNLVGTFFCMREALRIMLPQRRGVIVNVSSMGGISGQPGIPHYSASKAGVLGLTRSVAAEVGPHGIRVNAVCPGAVDTRLTADRLQGQAGQQLVDQIPLRRVGQPGDIATAILFLACDDSGFFTGQWISPNGGRWMG